MKSLILPLFLVINCLAAFGKEQTPHNNSLCFMENKGQVIDQYGNQRNDIDLKVSGEGISVFIGQGQLHYQWLQATDKNSSAVNSYRMDVELAGYNKNAQLV